MNDIEETTVGLDTEVFAAAGSSLYLSEKVADVHFVLKSSERVPAHKNLLVAASEVFDTMFYGSVPEKGDVKIVDASAAAFKEFLQFFYFTKVQLSMETVGDVMYLGNKYNVPQCMEVCAKFLHSNITAENVILIYGLAIMHGQRKLQWNCEWKISNNTEDVLKSPIFLDCSKLVLEHVLKLYLSTSEVAVFKTCMSWVKNISEQTELTREIVQEHLGHLFYEIGFRSMTNDEFVDLLPAYEKLFTDDERSEIFEMIRDREYAPKQFNGYIRNSLRPKWNKPAVIVCGTISDCAPYRIDKVDVTRFTANKALLLGAITWNQLFKNENEGFFQSGVPAEVTIATVPDRTKDKTTEGRVVYNDKFKFGRFGLKETELFTPILICAGVEYEIRLDLQHPVWITRAMHSEAQLAPDINIEFDSSSRTTDDQIKGLIRFLSFNRVI